MTDGNADASLTGLHSSPCADDSPRQTPASSPGSNTLSPTQTLAHFSSPELPPLPALPQVTRLLSTPTASGKADLGSKYYTASWGSPYLAPQESSSPGKAKTIHRDWSDDFEEESPDPKFGLGHLLPSRLPFLNQQIPPARPTTPTSDQASEQSAPSANRNWFSPTRSRAHRASNSFGDSYHPQAESGFGNQSTWWGSASKSVKPLPKRPQSQDLREIKLGNFDGVNSFVSADPESPGEELEAARLPRGRNSTLTQADLWPAIKSFKDSISSMYNSRWATADAPKPSQEPSSSATTANAPTADILSESKLPPTEPATPAFELAEPPLLQRITSALGSSSGFKKRVPYKGKKVIVIGLPSHGPLRSDGRPLLPLTVAEVAERLRSYEQQGYDTRGFDHWKGGDDDSDTVIHPANRSVFPDEAEQRQTFNERNFSVALPDTSQWDSHVKKVLNDKLRALGVTSAGEEPVPSAMSRQASSQFSSVQPFSPPLRTSSAGSQIPGGFPLGNFPASFVPGSSNHTSRASIASPVSSIDTRRASLHMHRQSMFSPSGLHTQIQMAPASARGWSPQQILSPPGLIQSGSPALSNSFAELSRQSPITPLQGHQPSQQFPFAQREELLAQMQRQQQQQQLLHLQQQQQQIIAQQAQQIVRPTSTLHDVPEAEENLDEPLHRSPDRLPEIVNPKPSHRHNISVKLEEGIHNAHYNLEGPANKQLDGVGRFESPFNAAPSSDEEAADVPPATTENAPREEVSKSVPALEVAKKVAVDTKEGSDIVTNHSILDSKAKPMEGNQQSADDAKGKASPNPWANDATFNAKKADTQHSSRPSHTSRASVSGLNVEAREFNPSANPHATFNPSIFSSSSFTFKGSAAAKPFVPGESKVLQQPSTAKPVSFNAAAPVFNPKFGSFGSVDTSESREFSFTPRAPVLKPTAAVFSPASSTIMSDRSVGSISSNTSNLIFRNLDLSRADVVKPSKKNKALPSLGPRRRSGSQSQSERELSEDEEGRVVQSDWRLKRARRVGDDGDSVPLFAMPSSPPTTATERLRQRSESPSPLQRSSVQAPAGKSSPVEKRPEIADTSPVASSIKFTQGQDEVVVIEEDSSAPEDPTEVDIIEVEEEPESPPPVQEQPRSRWPIILPDDAVPEPRPERVSPVPQIAENRDANGLSALARPFVFNATQEPERRSPEIQSDFSPQFTRPADPIRDVPSADAIVSPLSSRASSRTDVEVEDKEDINGDSSDRRVNSSMRYYEDLEQPTFQEIDAVMQHFHDEGSDAGVERADDASWPASSPGETLPQTEHPADYKKVFEIRMRSDAPSPSPRRLFVPPTAVDVESSAQDPFSDGRAAVGSESPTRRRNVEERRPVSDWDDVVSSGENESFQGRASFLDRRVSSLVRDAVRDRLNPVEDRLAQIQLSLENLSGPELRRVRSRATADSDADDEDDDDQGTDYASRNFSPRRDPKMEKMRQIFVDALANHPSRLSPAPQKQDFGELYNVMADIKTSVLNSVSQILQPNDIREIVEESVAKQNEAMIRDRDQAIVALDDARTAEFTHALDEANSRLTEETIARQTAEKRARENQRLLQLAEEELALHKKAMNDGGQANKLAEVEVTALQETLQMVEAERDTLQKTSDHTAAQLKQENEALQATLEEYRISSDKWRHDIQRSAEEKEKAQSTYNTLRVQVEETIRIKEAMRGRIEKLHEDMSAAAGQVARERAQWTRADAEHRTRYEVLKARAEAEARTRERFETELERLEGQEREFMRSRSMFDHAQKENSRLEELVSSLRFESAELQKTSDQYAREFREVREQGRVELQRTRALLEVDIEAMNNQVQSMRVQLDNETGRAAAEVERVRLEADAVKARCDLELEEADDAKRIASREAMELKNGALADLRHALEERMEDLRKQHRRDLDHFIQNKTETESFLKEGHAKRLDEVQQRHARDIDQIQDEMLRSETYHNEQLDLVNEKNGFLQDKVRLLEEKLEIVKSAAHAAASAAKFARAPALEQMQAAMQPRGQPEKINSQALRETVAVLQDQLQEREARIEQLEQDMGEFDTDAPMKIKALDTEVAWLRELLGVRLDDLGDLVNALSQSDFNRDAVRNAAIRIRAGLQMEQQEKERQMSGSQSYPTLASISSFASPRAAQLTAAWGNWRKGKDLLPSGLSQSISSLASSGSQTPSKAPPATAAAQSFISGLMTPPTSNLRHSPSPTNLLSEATAGSTRPLAAHGSLRDQFTRSTSEESITTSESTTQSAGRERGRTPIRRLGKQPALLQPTTPPLMRKASYDQDATEDGDYSTAGFYDDDESTVEGTPRMPDRRRLSGGGFVRSTTTGSPTLERFPGMS